MFRQVIDSALFASQPLQHDLSHSNSQCPSLKSLQDLELLQAELINQNNWYWSLPILVESDVANETQECIHIIRLIALAQC